MENPLIYIFDDFDAAQRARAELIKFGFEAPAVNLDVRDDEAGPVQGNFTVGDNPAAAGRLRLHASASGRVRPKIFWRFCLEHWRPCRGGD